MEGTVFTPCLEGMRHVKSNDGEMLTKPFLDVCKLILPVIDKFGAAMALVKSDIGGNISRLESKYSSDPSKFHLLYSMVQAEVETKKAKASSSCANGLLWLTRQECRLPAVRSDLHRASLYPGGEFAGNPLHYKGVAMKLAPDRNKFMEVVGGSGDLNADIGKFCTNFSPLLEENHKFLASVGLDDLKAS